jgi:hypothetical protein
MALLDFLSQCFTNRPGRIRLNEKPAALPPPDGSDAQKTANDCVELLFSANRNDPHLKAKLDNIISVYGWSDYLAEKILDGIVEALENGKEMATAIKDAFEKSTDAALSFAKEHPYYSTLIALGILVLLSPWAIEALGFGELGPIADTFASWWESQYAGYIPKGSLFSFAQRLRHFYKTLGMPWKLNAAPKTWV